MLGNHWLWRLARLAMLTPCARTARALPVTPAVYQIQSVQRRHFTLAQDTHTIKKLLIKRDTRVIYQGFTGRVATSNATESIAYGTNVVGGVTPGKEGEHLGLPLLPSVRAAREQLKADATAIFVPAVGAAKAIEEAIEAEIPLIVAVAEHIPLHDMLRITSMLATSNSRLVGANSPGIISPLHSCRIGFQPLPMYKPGNIGVVAKSGTLSYEAVASLTRAGLGQSLCIGTGGDMICGTNLLSGFTALKDDPDTHGIVIVGEVGGTIERTVAREVARVREQGFDKPVVALVAGRSAPHDRVMGHAGAFRGIYDHGADRKHSELSKHVAVVDHPEQIGETMKRLLAEKASGIPQTSRQNSTGDRRRGKTSTIGVQARRPRPRAPATAPPQSRTFILPAKQASQLIRDELPDIEVGEEPDGQGTTRDMFQISVSLDRMTMGLMLISPKLSALSSKLRSNAQRHQPIHFSYSDDARNNLEGRLEALHSKLDGRNYSGAVRRVARAVNAVHRRAEAVEVRVRFEPLDLEGETYRLASPFVRLDDSAFRTAGGQEELFAARDTAAEDQLEVEAERHGIVYVRLNRGDASANIGTLVNGAGLAMNTVDVLALEPHLGKCVNFLDTGGKATSDTVRRSFELILRDERTRVIFVNIFGGLTDCAMIAEGIMLAFREVDMRGVPVVVRLRGTNEAEGQRRIAESGLPLEAFDSFADAAARVIQISREKSVAAIEDRDERLKASFTL